MAQANAQGQRRRRRRTGTAVAASLLAHTGIFALIGFEAPRLMVAPTSTRSSVVITLVPDLLPLARISPAPAAPSMSAPTMRTPPPRAPAPPRPAPSRPAPTTAAQAAAPVEAPGRAPPGRAADASVGYEGGGVREVLRTSVGCEVDDAALINLTPAERAKCHARYGADARGSTSISGIGALKRNRFDAQAAADERRRADRTGPLPNPVQPCTSTSAGYVAGSNFGGGGPCLAGSQSMRIPQP